MIELFIYCLPRVLGLVLEICQLVFEPIGGGASFYRESRSFVAVNKWVSVGFVILLLCRNMSNQELLDE